MSEPVAASNIVATLAQASGSASGESEPHSIAVAYSVHRPFAFPVSPAQGTNSYAHALPAMTKANAMTAGTTAESALPIKSDRTNIVTVTKTGAGQLSYARCAGSVTSVFSDHHRGALPA